MSKKATDKVIDALAELMAGYSELQDAIESDYRDGDSDDPLEEGSDVESEIDAAIVTEMRTALEAVMDSEDLGAEEFASLLSSLTEALEEIDPDVFEVEEGELVEGEDDSDLYVADDEDFEDDELDDELDDEFDEDEDDDDDL